MWPRPAKCVLSPRGLAEALVMLAMGCGGRAQTTAYTFRTDVGFADGGTQGAADSAPQTCPIPEGIPTDAGRAAGEVPLVHRSSGSGCPRKRGSVTTTPVCGDAAPCAMGDPCAQDSDCTAGSNGRCVPELDETTYCTYDACFADSDCEGGLCICRASSASSAANLCYAEGNCAADSDCIPGLWCSPSLPGNGACSCASFALCADAGNAAPGTTTTMTPPQTLGCWESSGDGKWTAIPCLCGNACGPSGYYCHTPCDVCVNDSDCSSGASCLYDVHKAIWDCFVAECGGR
jgi:hypothetical protein